MKQRIVNLRICGVGGQGVITAGMIASAASMIQGKNSIMSEIHGLAQRGGAISVDIRFGDVLGSMIPEGECDVLIALEPMEALRNAAGLKKGGTVIIGSDRVSPISMGIRKMEYPEVRGIFSDKFPDLNVRQVDSVRLAEEAGDHRSANTVLLGVAIGSGAVPLDPESIEKSIKERYRGKALDVNLKAFHLGKSAQ